jgi:hypothetical protein
VIAPLVVNTSDGTCWTRRGVLRGGEALYAPEGVCSCPEFVMATLAELAEHGIVGSADVLPVPLGPARSFLDRARDAVNARMAKDDLRLVLENVVAYAARLEAERHSTNEALDDAVQQLRRDQVLLAEYARQRLREGMAAEARHQLDPADRAFAELACRCCNSETDGAS